MLLSAWETHRMEFSFPSFDEVPRGDTRQGHNVVADGELLLTIFAYFVV
jgi:hypothetical protein